MYAYFTKLICFNVHIFALEFLCDLVMLKSLRSYNGIVMQVNHA